MKKVFKALMLSALVLIVCFSLVACGTNFTQVNHKDAFSQVQASLDQRIGNISVVEQSLNSAASSRTTYIYFDGNKTLFSVNAGSNNFTSYYVTQNGSYVLITNDPPEGYTQTVVETNGGFNYYTSNIKPLLALGTHFDKFAQHAQNRRRSDIELYLKAEYLEYIGNLLELPSLTLMQININYQNIQNQDLSTLTFMFEKNNNGEERRVTITLGLATNPFTVPEKP